MDTNWLQRMLPESPRTPQEDLELVNGVEVRVDGGRRARRLDQMGLGAGGQIMRLAEELAHIEI
jgi:hypothetical protein